MKKTIYSLIIILTFAQAKAQTNSMDSGCHANKDQSGSISTVMSSDFMDQFNSYEQAKEHCWKLHDYSDTVDSQNKDMIVIESNTSSETNNGIPVISQTLIHKDDVQQYYINKQEEEIEKLNQALKKESQLTEVPELGAELANEISESRIADAYEKAGFERTSVTDRYVLEYLECSRGIDTESEITCLNSTLGALDKSSLSEDEKVRLKTGMHEISYIRMIDLSSPPKTSVQAGIIQNPETARFEYVAMLTTDKVENRAFYSDTDMLLNFVLESTEQGVQPIIWFNLFSYTDTIIREYHKEKWPRILDLKNKAIENNIQLIVRYYEYGMMKNGIYQQINSTKLTGISELEFSYLDLDIEDSTNMDYGDYVFIENIDEYEKFLNTLSVVGIVDQSEYEVDFSNSFVIGIMSPSSSSCYKENLRSVVYVQSKITLLIEIEKKDGIQACNAAMTKHIWVAIIEKPSLSIEEIEVVRN